MQSFFLTALLFTSTLAAPSLQSHRSMFKRQACDQANQPTADQVMTAINTWMIDIQTVNSFLDNSITQPAAVVSQAPNVLTFASDEPNELGEFLCPRFLQWHKPVPIPCKSSLLTRIYSRHPSPHLRRHRSVHQRSH